MDFSSFAQCFYEGRGKTALTGIKSQAGIVRFFLHDICPAVEEIGVEYSDDYYRAVFNGKRVVQDHYWKKLEHCLERHFDEAAYYLGDSLDQKTLENTAISLGIDHRYPSENVLDVWAVADSIMAQLITIARGRGEGRNIAEARYYTVILFNEIRVLNKKSADFKGK